MKGAAESANYYVARGGQFVQFSPQETPVPGALQLDDLRREVHLNLALSPAVPTRVDGIL